MQNSDSPQVGDYHEETIFHEEREVITIEEWVQNERTLQGTSKISV